MASPLTVVAIAADLAWLQILLWISVSANLRIDPGTAIPGGGPTLLAFGIIKYPNPWAKSARMCVGIFGVARDRHFARCNRRIWSLEANRVTRVNLVQ